MRKPDLLPPLHVMVRWREQGYSPEQIFEMGRKFTGSRPRYKKQSKRERERKRALKQEIAIAIISGSRSIGEVCASVDCSRSTAHRYIQRLTNEQVISKTDKVSRTLRAGPRAAIIKKSGEVVAVGKVVLVDELDKTR